MDSVGEGEGGKIWENGIETCILSYAKQIASPVLMHDTGCSGLVHWDDPEGWDGEGIQEGRDICIHAVDSLRCTAEISQHCKATLSSVQSLSRVRLFATP